MGGDELDKQAKTQKQKKVVEGKKVHVEVPSETNTNTKQVQEQVAWKIEKNKVDKNS